MSAFAGIVEFDGRPVDRRGLATMVQCLEHRGTVSRVWIEDSVGLGQVTLWTTPESISETGPSIGRSGKVVIAADVRIDNRNELITALELAGQPSQLSDGALVLAAYEKWGEECPAHLLGDFAFAIWDAERRQLFCARDHIGVKCLYYYRTGTMVAVASEIDALLALPSVPQEINEIRVADYLVSLFEDKVSTFYRDIWRLAPAHGMTIRQDDLTLRSYWKLDPEREIQLGSDEEYAEAFSEIFAEAIRCRLRSAYPVGSLLSGGLDSSSITCVARSLYTGEPGTQLHTFSARFHDVPESDEGSYIKAVLDGGGVQSHHVRVDHRSPLCDDRGEVLHYDVPVFAPNLFMHDALYSAAHQSGVRVLLDGFDGDTTVSHGLALLPELLRSGRWFTLASEIQGLARNADVSRWRFLWYRSLRPLLPDTIRRVGRQIRSADKSPWYMSGVIDPGFANRVGLAERGAALLGERAMPARTSREDHRRRLSWGLIPAVLELADQSAGRYGIEPRYPFFDKRLVEFCLALPGRQKMRAGWTRFIMRRAMVDKLPEAIRWRRKKGDLSINFTRQLLALEGERLTYLLGSDELLPYIDPQALNRAWINYSTRGDHQASLEVWRAAMLANWLRQVKGGRVQAGPEVNNIQWPLHTSSVQG